MAKEKDGETLQTQMKNENLLGTAGGMESKWILFYAAVAEMADLFCNTKGKEGLEAKEGSFRS